MNKTTRGFLHAKHVSEMSDFKKAKVGCVVMYKGKVIATGFNSSKEHPVQQYYNQYRQFDGVQPSVVKPMLHAEIAALYPKQNMKIDWKRAEVYVYRTCKDREHGLARPCPACMQMIRDLGIRRIHYTTDDSFISEVFDN